MALCRYMGQWVHLSIWDHLGTEELVRRHSRRLNMLYKCLLVGALLSASPLVYGAYIAPHAAEINSIGTLSLGKSGTLEIKERPLNGAWWGDTFNLVVSQDGKIAVLPFDATYGIFKVMVSPLIGNTQPEYVLIAAQGRGTAATSWYLNIYQIRNHKFVRMYRKLIAQYFGPTNIWWYEVDYATMVGGTQAILLTLRISSPDSNQFVDKTLIPKQKFLKIYWDSAKNKFVCGSNSDGLNVL